MADYGLVTGTDQAALDAAVANLKIIEKSTLSQAEALEATIIAGAIIKKAPYGLAILAAYKYWEKDQVEEAVTAYNLQGKEISAIKSFLATAEAKQLALEAYLLDPTLAMDLEVPPVWA